MVQSTCINIEIPIENRDDGQSIIEAIIETVELSMSYKQIDPDSINPSIHVRFDLPESIPDDMEYGEWIHLVLSEEANGTIGSKIEEASVVLHYDSHLSDDVNGFTRKLNLFSNLRNQIIEDDIVSESDIEFYVTTCGSSVSSESGDSLY